MNYLESERILLRPVTRDDCDLIVKWRNDIEVSKWLFSKPVTRAECIEWFNSDRSNRLDYIICASRIIKPIGTVQYKNIHNLYEVEAGKYIGDEMYRGNGYATEAFKLWLMHGFNDLGFKKINIFTKADNKKNIILNLNLGFSIDSIYADPVSGGILKMTISEKDLV